MLVLEDICNCGQRALIYHTPSALQSNSKLHFGQIRDTDFECFYNDFIFTFFDYTMSDQLRKTENRLFKLRFLSQ